MPDVPVRIEAAAFRGRPNYFGVAGPWREASARLPQSGSGFWTTGTVVLLTIFFGTIVVGAWLALRYIRKGRGDRKAFRVALFLLALRLRTWAVLTHHVPTGGEVVLFITGLQPAVFWSCFVGVMYLVLEPSLKRRWPERVISWSRLLAGDFRDPLIGRDILIGALFGLGVGLSGDDYAVRKGFQITYGLDDVPKAKDLEGHGERWRPFRSVASWYMWQAVRLARQK